MKFSAALVALFGSCVYAGRPSLSLSLRNGNFDGLDGLEPTINWEGSASAGDIELVYGIESAVRPTTDVASLPRKLWGKASIDVAGWGFSARAARDVAAGDATALVLDANNDDADLSLRVVASAGSDFAVNRVEATKGLDLDGARVTVNPRYDVGSGAADVVVAYSNDATSVELTASADSQEVTVKHQMANTGIKITVSAESQEVTIDQKLDNTGIRLTASANNQEVVVLRKIGADDCVTAGINNNGDIAVEWERSLGDDSSLTATLRPNESLDVEYKDGAWTANVNMPMDGANVESANVSIKRDILL